MSNAVATSTDFLITDIMTLPSLHRFKNFVLRNQTVFPGRGFSCQPKDAHQNLE